MAHLASAEIVVLILEIPRTIAPEAMALFVDGLGSSDRRRYGGILDPSRALQFLLGRALIGYMAVELGAGLHEIDFDLGGRPRFRAGSSAAVDFSISHCASHVAIAFSGRSRVGIDLEVVAGYPEASARRFFRAEENRWLTGLSSRQRERAFYDLWTIKEACAKPGGHGLRPPLPAVVVPLGREGAWARGRWWRFARGERLRGAVASLEEKRGGRPACFREPIEIGLTSLLRTLGATGDRTG